MAAAADQETEQLSFAARPRPPSSSSGVMMMNTEIRDFVLPSAPSKTLWFEFLFVDDLLESHLAQVDCDPSPIELIIQFVNNANASQQQQQQQQQALITNGGGGGDNFSGRKGQDDKKSFLLKLLAVKTAAFFDWDLDLLEKRLPLPKQYTVISSLRHMCQEHADIGTKLFAEITYYRWCIRSLTKASYPVRSQKGLQVPIPQLQQIDPSFTPPEVIQSLVQELQKEVGTVITMLEEMLKEGSIIRAGHITMPAMACFNVRKPHFDWNQAKPLTADLVEHSIRYELGKYFMIRDPPDYVKAYKHFAAIPEQQALTFPNLTGYISACRGMSEVKQEEEMDQEESSEAAVTKVFDDLMSQRTSDFSILEKVSAPFIMKMLKQYKSQKSGKCIPRCLTSYLCVKVPGLRDALRKERTREPDPPAERMEEDVITEKDIPIQHQLLEAKTPQLVLDLSCHINQSPAEINHRWRVPNIIRDALRNLPDNLRNRSLIRLAKANELRSCLRFAETQHSDSEVTIRDLYVSVMEETQTLIGKQISELLHFEILETDLEDHLNSKDVDERDLARKEVMIKCANALCLPAVKSGILNEISDDLVETICVTLLDRFHSSLENHYNHPNPIVRLTYILYMCRQGYPVTESTDLGKYLWETMTQLLLENTPTHPHKKVKFQQNVPPPVVAVSLRRFISRLRSPEMQLVIAVALIKMLNDVRDNTRNELSMPLIVINGHPLVLHWPHVTVSQATVLPDLRTISHVLKTLLDRALSGTSSSEHYKTWIRCRAELALIEAEFEVAMKNFLIMLCTMSEYYTRFSRSKEEDHVIQRMITASNRLNCHTQSAVLQQMLSEPNYALAFKSLSERSCYDSCDDLMDCIWDVTMLEFLVNLNSKRGDTERKSRNVQLIGQLELNGNNSKDILTEAANVRKRKFFRILTKKYM